MLPVGVALFLGRILSKLPFWPLLYSFRFLSFLLIPFANIIPYLKIGLNLRPTPLQAMKYRYRRCLTRMEGHIFRYHSTLPVLDKLDLVNEQYFQQCRRQERGVLLVSIHHLYYRLFIYWQSQYDPSFQPYIIKTQMIPKRARLQQFINKQHEELFPNRILYSEKDLKKLLKLLKGGGWAIHLQDVLQETAEPIQFLNRNVKNPLSALKMGQISNSLILPFITCSQPKPLLHPQKWAIRFWPPIDPHLKDAKEQLIGNLEEMVHTYPETWEFWNTIIPKT